MKVYIKRLLREGLLDGDDTIYHRTNKSSMIRIVRDGLHLGSKGFYGIGFYCVTDLASALTSYSKKHYGNYILEYSISNLDGFLILDNYLAKKTYGDNGIDILSQLKHILGGDIPYYDSIISVIDSNKNFEYTSEIALQLAKIKPLLGDINGMIYTNKNDGNCIVIYKSAINSINLKRYSNDNGKTWVIV